MTKQKVGIITYHQAAYNAGAMLQAYALHKSIQDFGYSCEVINHKIDYNSFSLDWFDDLVREYGFIKGFAKYLNRRLKGMYSGETKEILYEKFLKNKIKTSPKYKTLDELSNVKYDAIVYGSDQIWNEKLVGGFRSEFFGGVVSADIPKIAYAASSGKGCISEEVKEQAYPLLKDFKFISAREKQLTDFLINDYNLKAVTTLDPTLLLSRESWRKVEAKLPENLKGKKYILLYTFDDPSACEYARKLSEETGLSIVYYRWCGTSKKFDDMIQISDIGPDGFLTLVDNAEYVCTSSFHGTVFSIIFQKKFYSITGYEFPVRIQDLLSSLQINNNMSEYMDRIVFDGSQYDAVTVNNNLQLLRENSLLFIKNSLTEVLS